MAQNNQTKFIAGIQTGYVHQGDSISLGAGMLGGEVLRDAQVSLPLKTLNRHGLIAGATGTGKTKTLQLIAGELSQAGVPTLLMDIKGDLSGLAQPGEENPAIQKRTELIGASFTPRGYSTEFLSLSNEKGTRLRATISEFGPLLLARILDLNSIQSGVLAAVFKYCDDNGLLLLDLKDLKKAVHFAAHEGKAELSQEYGSISPASAGAILRKLAALEQQGAGKFFGERSFETDDLTRINENGEGMISIIRLKDMTARPMLFGVFMLQMLAEIFEKFPEQGDADRPRLVVFIDEAHLIFKGAPKPLLEQIEMTVKLIRSKGVGIFFCTQNPTDIPRVILSQLGLKVQHSLRAFTARDRKDVKSAAENFPDSPYYKVDSLLTEMGIGEALVTALNEKGKPTPLAHTMLRAPSSRMGVLQNPEIEAIIAQSEIFARYNENIDRESAYEMLSKKVEEANSLLGGGGADLASKAADYMKSSLARQVGSTIAREVARGLLGVIGLGGGRRR